MKSVVTLFAHRVLPGLIFLMGLGCGSTNRLHEVDFEDARVAVVTNIPPWPVVFTDVFYEARIDPDDPVGSIFRAGTAIAKQAEARQAQARMDSALAYVDVADRVAWQALRRSAPTLGYRPTNHPEDADFILDLHIANYGLVADSWEATVHFEVDAEMLLVDRRTRRVIWKKHLREVEPVSHAGIGRGATFGNVFTAAALSTLSVEQMVVALEHLADFTAARLIATLRHDYSVSRRAGESESR